MNNRPKVGIGVIIIKSNKILLGKRKSTHGKDTWGFSGGHLEFNEEIEDCAKREVSEEAGIQVKNVRVGIFTNDIFKKTKKYYITLYLISEYDSGEPRVIEPDKFERWEWFEWDNLPHPLFLSIENLLEQNFNPFE